MAAVAIRFANRIRSTEGAGAATIDGSAFEILCRIYEYVDALDIPPEGAIQLTI